MDKIFQRGKEYIEKKINKFTREMELFGLVVVVSKYSEYVEEKEEDYLWWLDLFYVMVNSFIYFFCLLYFWFLQEVYIFICKVGLKFIFFYLFFVQSYMFILECYGVINFKFGYIVLVVF